MGQVMELANSWPLWVFAILIIGIVVFQSVKFIRLASKTAYSVDMTSTDVKLAIRTGAISSLGPSFAIIIVAISLLTLIGDPVTLIRIGIIGSAPIETVGASIGAEAAGSELGSTGFTEQAFTNAVWVMCLGGMGWLIFTALFTKSLGKIEKSISGEGKKNKKAIPMKALSTAAMIGAFSALGTGEMIKGLGQSIVLVVAFIAMPIILWSSNKLHKRWLREWSLGIVVVIGLVVGYFVS